MKVLVLGGGGQVARAVLATVPPAHEAVGLTREQLDIRDEAAVAAALAGSGAAWIVNGAAYTAVDRAESEPEAARALNDTAVGILARAAARAGCRLLHLSTDFVFDGRSSRAYLPTDAVNPLGVYGATKLGGERHVLEAVDGVAKDGIAKDGVVLRTSWVYASSGTNFVLTMLRLMREREVVRVVDDQIGCPTWATSIARAIWALIEQGASGLHHWTDRGVASWYDFAVAIQEEALARRLLTRAVPIVAIPASQYPTPAKRPSFSLLNSESARAASRLEPLHWRHNLRIMLDELHAA